MKPWIRFGLSLALVGGVGACNDEPGQDYDDTVDAASVGDVADFAWVSAHEMMGMIGEGGLPAPQATRLVSAAIQRVVTPSASRSDRVPPTWARFDVRPVPLASLAPDGLRLIAPPGCSSSESGIDAGGDPIDANGNGVPDDWRQTVACEIQQEVAPDSIVTSRQEQELRVRERTGALFGFDFAGRALLSQTSNFGAYFKLEQRVEQTLSIGSDHATTHELDWHELRSKPGTDEPEQHEELLRRGDLRFDPESAIALETPLPDGTVTLGGEFRFVNSEVPIAIRFVLDTPEKLEFSHACEVSNNQPFVGGILRGRFNGRSSVGFTIEFNSCGNDADFETFGIEGTPVAPQFHP